MAKGKGKRSKRQKPPWREPLRGVVMGEPVVSVQEPMVAEVFRDDRWQVVREDWTLAHGSRWDSDRYQPERVLITSGQAVEAPWRVRRGVDVVARGMKVEGPE